jgi:hypothetical protein
MDHLKQLKISYNNIFESDDGKLVMSDLEKRCHYHATTNVKGDSHEATSMLYL